MKIRPNALGATTFLAIALAAITFLVFSELGTPPPTGATPTPKDNGPDAEVKPPPQSPPPAESTAPTAAPTSAPEFRPQKPPVKVPDSPVPTTPPESGGLISGTIVDPLGNPMSDMRAHLIPTEGRDETSRATQEDGAFLLDKLEPGTYRLIARRDGTRSKDFTGAQDIHLSRDEVLTDIRLVYRGGKHTITGRVTDTRGAPIPDVRVSANSTTTIAYGKIDTDGDGRYTIAIDDGQHYTVKAHKRGYVTPDDYKSVTPGERDVDFTLAACATISGQLVDAATGNPIQHFGYARYTGVRTKPDYTSSVLLGVDDPEGRFRIGEVAPGQSTIEFRAHGYAPEMHVLSGIEPGDHVKELRIPMRPGPRIEGQVVNQAGEPVPGATIHLTGRAPIGRITHNTPRPLFYPEESTDAEGNFEVDTIGDDLDLLMAQHADYANTVVPIDLKPNGTTHVRITMLAGGKVVGTLFVNDVPKYDEEVEIRAPTRQMLHSQCDTDKQGRFEFTQLPEGEVLVMANVTHDGSSRRIERTVVVSNGETSQIDLHIDIGTASLSGAVTIGGEIPHRGHLTLFSREQDAMLNENAGCSVANDGTYLLTGLIPGAYELHARASLPGRGVTYHRVEQVEVTNAQNSELSLDLDNARVQGLLTGISPDKTVRIVVFPASTAPESLQLSFSTRAGALSWALAHGQVSESGIFEINGLSTGEYTMAAVEFDTSGRPIAIHTPRRVQVNESTNVDINFHLP